MTMRRTWLRRIGLVATIGATGCQSEETTTLPSGGLAFRSPAFTDGGSIPEAYTADGTNRSPPIRIESVPEGTETLALVVTDPDADGFVHWLLWNVPGERREISEGVQNSATLSDVGDAHQGTNDFGTVGYRGPAPPADDEAHTYRFALTALDTALGVDGGAERSTLESAMDSHRLARTVITGTYDR